MLTGVMDECPAGGQAVAGHKVAPGTGHDNPDWGDEIVIPITVTKPGAHQIDGFTVTYEQGRRSHQAQHSSKFIMCTDHCAELQR